MLFTKVHKLRGIYMKCKSTIEFGDDFGDNSFTFHCQKEEGHNGEHKEEGDMYGQPYILKWKDEK